jgi:Protein of unknown function (DUF2793)
MTATDRLQLPLIAAGQAQKHITHNDMLVMLDAIVQLSVLDSGLNTPPASPAPGARHIIGPTPTGLWAGRISQIAVWLDSSWTFLSPVTGWRAYMQTTGDLVVYDGIAWRSALNPVPLLGVNTSADTTNRLAVSGPSSLFTGGAGGHQIKINKAVSTDTASLVLQTAFSGKAEIGLTGDDRLRFKVQGADAIWRDALAVDQATGMVSLPATALGENLLVNGDFSINQRGFAGGALALNAYGFDRWKASTTGTSLSLSGDILTLASGSISQTIEPQLGPFDLVTISCDDLVGSPLSATIGGQWKSSSALHRAALASGGSSLSAGVSTAFGGIAILRPSASCASDTSRPTVADS